MKCRLPLRVHLQLGRRHLHLERQIALSPQFELDAVDVRHPELGAVNPAGGRVQVSDGGVEDVPVDGLQGGLGAVPARVEGQAGAVEAAESVDGDEEGLSQLGSAGGIQGDGGVRAHDGAAESRVVVVVFVAAAAAVVNAMFWWRNIFGN